MKNLLFILLLPLIAGFACQPTVSEQAAAEAPALPVDSLAQFALQQYTAATQSLSDTSRMPRNSQPDGSWIQKGLKDWTSGFFPGVLWYLYALTDDAHIREQAVKWTLPMKRLEHFTGNHDIGFMLFCSVGNRMRFTDEADAWSEEVLVNGARALVTRFDPRVGLIRSWDFGEWQYPVIIDNMMNLELLMWAFKHTGDSTFYRVATTHADNTAEHHFRPDYSTWHVVSYDTLTGQPEEKVTFQGYSDDSQWARGQAWGIYGFTLMYRETGDPA
jgi:unsaturated chondroitin disaccharide hydrolase